jgi:uncharacterized protein (TIGR00251 family)
VKLKRVIAYSLRNDDLLLSVQVVPRASRSEIVGEHDGSLRVRIAAPPVDGAANEELTRVLAKAFKVPRAAVKLVAGQSGRLKQVRIAGVKLEMVKLLLETR